MRHRKLHSATAAVGQVCTATVKFSAAMFVFTVCLMVTLRYFGVPIPMTADQFLGDLHRLTSRIF
jgi:hypothetical protein